MRTSLLQIVVLYDILNLCLLNLRCQACWVWRRRLQ